MFCSFSSAETQWIHLRILGQLVDHKQYTNDELVNLHWEEKCTLIQSDPLTCATHFDYQVNTFLRYFLLSNAEPLGKISDWFYRVEYQQRGSPHIHMMIWIESAPVFGEDSDSKVTSFIDNIITCEEPVDNAELLEPVKRQIHKHSHTCRKKSKNESRFNYPQPPMRQTVTLHPFSVDEIPMNEVKSYKDSWKKIHQYLNDLKEGMDITFDNLLVILGITEDDYILAIRSSINTPTIFLKRSPNELRINNHNVPCLSAWRANMDIQFILDVYACAVYITNYISKAKKGMSELLRQACTEARKATIKQQVRDIGSKFLNNVEISVLQLPMCKASRQVVFINTSTPSDRINVLKPLSDNI